MAKIFIGMNIDRILQNIYTCIPITGMYFVVARLKKAHAFVKH